MIKQLLRTEQDKWREYIAARDDVMLWHIANLQKHFDYPMTHLHYDMPILCILMVPDDLMDTVKDNAQNMIDDAAGNGSTVYVRVYNVDDTREYWPELIRGGDDRKQADG